MRMWTKKQKKASGLFFLFVGLFLLVCNAITPLFYRAMPNDYVRTKLILSTLSDSLACPEFVIFGNSRGMSGLDGYLLEEQLEGHPQVYSFTSTRQALWESSFYYDRLPTSTHIVVQCIDVERLKEEAQLTDPNIVALRMYGYELSERCREWLPEQLIEQYSEWTVLVNYKARNCLFSGITTALREWLDDDVIAGATATELHYPRSTHTLRNTKVYDREIAALNNDSTKYKQLSITEEQQHLITKSMDFLKQRGIFICYLLMPHNPDILSFTQKERRAAVELFKHTFPNAYTVDCVNLLEAADFYDAIHLNEQGARKLTERLIQALSAE